jgi:DNA-binding FrmR family transcriptional regulator
MDPFELLKKDHKKVSTLFKQIESAAGDAKLRIFRQLKSELDVHAHVEETIFYPALEREKETREITLEAYEEHRVVKDLLSQLDAATSANEEWEARLTVLKENVEHHVEEEEGELFDKASDVLTGEQAEELGDQMQEEKNRQPGYGSEQQGKAPARTRKSGIIRRVVKAIGAGVSAARASRSAGSKKPAKATKKAGKKTTGKAEKKSASKATKKAAARKTGAAKSARKGTTKQTSKRGSKATKRTTKS